MEAIGLSGVRVERDGEVVLEGVDLVVAPGEHVAVIGRSGSGKTSLLRVIAGLDRPAEGTVRLKGRPVTGAAREATLVFSEDTVLDHLDVAGNLGFPLEVSGRAADRRQRVVDTADRFWLRRLLSRDPGTLSVGQRQVVAAARAVVRPDVEVVLVDEPLTGTDPHRRARLMGSVMSRPGVTVLFATNDPADVRRWADRVVVLADRAVAQVGPPADVYAAPRTLAVAELMGELNRFPATVVEHEGWAVEVAGSTLRLTDFPPGLIPGRRVVVGIRPDRLEPAAAGIPFDRRLRGTVGRIETLGARRRVLFALGGRAGISFVAETSADVALAGGAGVDWYVPADSLVLFDPVSGLRL